MITLAAAPLPAQNKEEVSRVLGLLNGAAALKKQGKLADAARAYESALPEAEKTFGKDNLTTAAVLTQLGQIYYEMGQYAKTEPLYRRGLQITELRLGKDHVNVAAAANDLAAALAALGQYPAAEPLYRRALGIREAKLGKEHIQVAQSLNNLANVYSELGDYAKAEESVKRSLAIAEARLGKNHPNVAIVLVNLASVCKKQGRYAEAEPLFRRSLEISEAAFGKDHLQVAISVSHLAELYRHMGEYARAEPLYQRALAIRKARAGAEHPLVAESLNDLANLHWENGEPAQAEALYQESLRIREACLGPTHPVVATTLNNLAAVCASTAQFGRAETLYRRSYAITRARLGNDHPDLAVALMNVAGLYTSMGQYAKAEPLYRGALGILERRLGKDHAWVADALSSLALVYRSLGQPRQAEEMYRSALRIRDNLGKDHPALATSLNSLAGLHASLGQYAKAEPLYLRALKIREARLGKDHPLVAQSLNDLAALYQDLKATEKAEPLLRRALAILEARFGEDHPQGGIALANLAMLQLEKGQAKDAVASFDRSRRVSRRHVSRVLPGLPPSEQAAFLAIHERRELARSLSLALPFRDDEHVAAHTAAWLVNGKAIAQEALAQSALLTRDSADPAVGKLADQLRQTRHAMARLSLQPAPAGQEKAHRQRVAQLAAQEQDLARRIAAAGSAAVVAEWADPERVRQGLPAGGVLVDLARLDVYDFKAAPNKRVQPARYVAWVTPAKGAVRVIDLGDAAKIDAAVKEVRQVLEGSMKLYCAKGEAEAEKALRAPLEALSRLVLHPLLKQAGPAADWVVSPDGNLWLVPFVCLLLPDGKYAIEKLRLRYALSGRDLMARPAAAGVKATTPLVLADPDFDLAPAGAPAAAAKPPARPDGTRALSGALRLGGIQRLPGTLAEARAVQKRLAVYAGAEPRVYTGREALVAVVKSARHPRVLMLATHGFFLPQTPKGEGAVGGDDKALPPPGWENPLLRCGLLLAGCNNAGKGGVGDDGVLTGLDVTGVDLRGCELVVLSACETGLGDVQNGEGVAGLRQAFQLAGAESVISTLWQVPDKSSAELMTRFFDGLAKGKGRAEALREAQLRLIEGRREESAAAHPLFWAAFTLTGR
jgi:CHAT domain-containing protein/Tfp pilus assembly protein PilF